MIALFLNEAPKVKLVGFAKNISSYDQMFSKFGLPSWVFFPPAGETFLNAIIDV